MIIDQADQDLIALVQVGLPLCKQPYAELGQGLAMSETEVIRRLQRMQQQRLIKRMGVVVQHRSLGYQANAMVVWDIPDQQIKLIGQGFANYKFVTLCYQRPRRLPVWPYNLFCMIHGQSRPQVLRYVAHLRSDFKLDAIDYQVLFSLRCFKQCGARYFNSKSHSHG